MNSTTESYILKAILNEIEYCEYYEEENEKIIESLLNIIVHNIDFKDFTSNSRDKFIFLKTLFQSTNKKLIEIIGQKISFDEISKIKSTNFNYIDYVKNLDMFKFFENKGMKIDVLHIKNAVTLPKIEEIINYILYESSHKFSEQDIIDIFCYFCWNNCFTYAKKLYSNSKFNLSINCIDSEYNSTPLMFACQNAHIAIVEWLLSEGASLDIINFRTEKNALDYASPTTREYLLQKKSQKKEESIMKLITTPSNEKVLIFSDNGKLMATVLGTDETHTIHE